MSALSSDHSPAEAGANLFSPAPTRRTEGIERFQYCSHIIEPVPTATAMEDPEALLLRVLRPIPEERNKRQGAVPQAAGFAGSAAGPPPRPIPFRPLIGP